MAWSDYGSKRQKLDYFGKLVLVVEEGRNEMPKYTDFDCRERQSLI